MGPPRLLVAVLIAAALLLAAVPTAAVLCDSYPDQHSCAGKVTDAGYCQWTGAGGCKATRPLEEGMAAVTSVTEEPTFGIAEQRPAAPRASAPAPAPEGVTAALQCGRNRLGGSACRSPHPPMAAAAASCRLPPPVPLQQMLLPWAQRPCLPVYASINRPQRASPVNSSAPGARWVGPATRVVGRRLACLHRQRGMLCIAPHPTRRRP